MLQKNSKAFKSLQKATGLGPFGSLRLLFGRFIGLHTVQHLGHHLFAAAERQELSEELAALIHMVGHLARAQRLAIRQAAPQALQHLTLVQPLGLESRPRRA